MEPQNDHDILIRLDEKVDGMVEKLNNFTDDHEGRIRTLETWGKLGLGFIYAVMAVWAVVTFIAPLIHK